MTTIAAGNRRLLKMAMLLECMADLADAGLPEDGDEEWCARFFAVSTEFMQTLTGANEHPRAACRHIRKFVKSRSVK